MRASDVSRPARATRRGIRVRNLLVGALLSTVVWWAGHPGAVGGLGSGPLTTPQPAASSAGLVQTHVVRPGDTVWSIARRAQPDGDVRPLVDRISAMRGNGPLQVGEEITVPLGG